jgi:alpha-galactosidase
MRPILRSRAWRIALSLLSVAVVTTSLSVVSVGNAPPANAADNGLSITPAMGWSSWSYVRRNPTAATIVAQANAMKSSGLTDRGYVYVNVDDFFQKCDGNGFMVDTFGRWVVDTAKFPGGIKPVADKVHANGQKFGLYVTPGIPKNAVLQNTRIEGTTYRARDIADTTRYHKNYNCRNMYYIDYSKPGAQAFINSWAKQYASWGVDYLKIDGVTVDTPEDIKAWAAALKNTGRPINYALSNNMNISGAALYKQYANSWRTQGDIECYCPPGGGGSGGPSYPLTSWAKVFSRFGSAAAWQPHAGRGGWNDLDSIQIGNGANDGITPDQRRSHYTLWAMAAAPLLLGSNLTQLDPVDLTILKNPRLIAVNQDGVAAKRIYNSSGGGVQQVWSKRERNGDYIVALFNTGTSGNQTVSTTWSAVGITSGRANVTDLWSGRNIGIINTSYSATLRPGETRLIRAVPA